MGREREDFHIPQVWNCLQSMSFELGKEQVSRERLQQYLSAAMRSMEELKGRTKRGKTRRRTGYGE